MSDFSSRWSKASFPYQTWNGFPPDAIVQVKNAYGDSRIAQASSLWWGYEDEMGAIGEGVICKARRLDRPLAAKQQTQKDAA